MLSYYQLSNQIRKCLGQDLSSYWLPIMQIFNTICPRPPLHEDRGLTVDSKREETEKVLSNDNRTTSGIFSKKSSGQDPNISQPNLQEKKSFLGFFRSKAPIDIPNEEILETDRSDIPIISKISANSGNNLRLKSESKMEDTCDLLLSDYGPPQYGMSFASWTLLVMARRYAEEVSDKDRGR